MERKEHMDALRSSLLIGSCFWILSIYPVSNIVRSGLRAPVFGAFFGRVILENPLTPTFIGALLLIGAGIVLGQSDPNRPRHGDCQ
jgi:hypothetical protein